MTTGDEMVFLPRVLSDEEKKRKSTRHGDYSDVQEEAVNRMDVHSSAQLRCMLCQACTTRSTDPIYACVCTTLLLYKACTLVGVCPSLSSTGRGQT